MLTAWLSNEAYGAWQEIALRFGITVTAAVEMGGRHFAAYLRGESELWQPAAVKALVPEARKFDAERRVSRRKGKPR